MLAIPNRRLALRHRFENGGFRYYGTVGLHPDTFQPVEIFLQAAKSGTAVEAMARDAAILASKALEHGATIDELRTALTRLENNAPASPVAALLDIWVTQQAKAEGEG